MKWQSYRLNQGSHILRDQQADSGGEGKSKRAGKYGMNGRRHSALWLGRKTPKFSGTYQKPEQQRQFGTGLVTHCPQGLFSPFFTFTSCHIFPSVYTLSPPTICPWVSEDEDHTNAIPIKFDNVSCVMMAKKSAKKCAAFSQFLFCLLNQLLFQILFWFPHFRCRCSCAELASSRYHTKQFLMCNDFAWKTNNLIEKCATKSTSTGTHTDRFKIS